MSSSVSRALRVLDAVAAAGDGVTPKAIARRLGDPLPSVYRTLGELVDGGYLVRLHTLRGYGLGYRVGQLQRSLVDQVRPPDAVRAVLHDLHVGQAAAAYLVVPRDLDLVIAQVEDCPEHPRPAGLHPGEPTPAHATAAGKAVLAGWRTGRLTEHLARSGTPRIAPHTLDGRRALDRELIRVRTEGAAVEVDEYQQGVAGVAVALGGPMGEPSGAVGVSVRRAEFVARRWELQRAVREAATRLSGVGVGAERG